MTPILDSTKYHVTVEEESARGDSFDIVAKIHRTDGKVKEFRVAGKSDVKSMHRHMTSLTESQCDQWFKNLS